MNFKQLSMGVFLGLIGFSVNADLTDKTKAKKALSVTTVVKPDDRQKYQNPTWFEVGAKCKVDTQKQSVSLKLELSKGYAYINKKKYKAPTVLESFSVNDQDKFNVVISKDAKVAVTLIQTGDTKKIKADCSISL